MTDAIVLQVDYVLADFREINSVMLRRQRRKMWWLWIAMFLCIAAAWVVGIMLSASASAPVPTPPPPAPTWREAFLPLAPYPVAFVVLFVLIRLFTRVTIRSTFAERNPLQRHHTITLATDGVSDFEPLAQHGYRWNAFGRWKETRNLLLLYLSANSIIPLPKRSFVSREQIDQCREMLRAMIDIPRSAQHAFEIMPALPATPLPAPPLPARPPTP